MMFSGLCAVVVCVLTLGLRVPQVSGYGAVPCPPLGPLGPGCTRRGVDVDIAIDTSRSMTAGNFSTMKTEIIKRLQAMAPNQDNVRVTVSTYEVVIKETVTIMLNASTKSKQFDAIRNLQFPGRTNDAVINPLVSRKGMYKGAEKINFVITDNPDSINTASEEARMKGNNVFTMSVGKIPPMMNHAGLSVSVFPLDGCEMQTRIARLTPVNCPPTQRTTPCLDRPVDMAIALDASNSIGGSKYFSEMVKFAQDLVRPFDIGTGLKQVRFAVHQFASEVFPETEIPLGADNNKTSLLSAIGQMSLSAASKIVDGEQRGTKSYLYKVVKHARENIFNNTNVRLNAIKVLLVLSDGIGRDLGKVKQEVLKARNDGVVIYVIKFLENVQNDYDTQKSKTYIEALTGVQHPHRHWENTNYNQTQQLAINIDLRKDICEVARI